MRMVRRILFLLLALMLASPLMAESQTVDRYASLTEKAGEADRLTCYFIDLDVPKGSKDKSGDSTLVISPDGKVMLIDCGHPDAGRDVVKLLQALGIKKIDVFVNSHPHIDHLGGFPEIADLFDIGVVYRTRLQYDASSYVKAFDAAIKKHNIPVKYLADGDSFEFGEQVHVDIYGPPQGEFTYPKGYPANATQFINDSSLAMKLTYGETTALFCGDLYRGGERDVLAVHEQDLKSDLAKANHHGGDTSNQVRWIKAVRPQVVVAMNDVMSSMSVYNNYKKYGATFYHTLYNGLVKVQLDDAHHLVVGTQYDSWVEKGGQ